MHTLLAFFLLVGCKPAPDLEAAPRWGLVWAEVTPGNTGFESRADGQYTNFLVWEFYADGWERKHEDSYYKCEVVQDIQGTPLACPGSAPGCVAAYTLEATLNDPYTTCDPGLAADPSYAGPARIAIGEVPADLQEEAPYGDWTMGWYVAFDTPEVEAHGYAYAKVLESNTPPLAKGWLPGETFVLWPAYVWEL